MSHPTRLIHPLASQARRRAFLILLQHRPPPALGRSPPQPKSHTRTVPAPPVAATAARKPIAASLTRAPMRASPRVQSPSARSSVLSGVLRRHTSRQTSPGARRKRRAFSLFLEIIRTTKTRGYASQRLRWARLPQRLGRVRLRVWMIFLRMRLRLTRSTDYYYLEPPSLHSLLAHATIHDYPLL